MSDASGSGIGKLGWLPSVTAALAFAACNGTLFLVALFSLFGISLVINPHVQAAVISLFAILTLVFVFSGYKRHRVMGPLVLAVVGSLMIVGTMYVAYDKAVESIGLVALIGSAIWAWISTKNAGL